VLTEEERNGASSSNFHSLGSSGGADVAGDIFRCNICNGRVVSGLTNGLGRGGSVSDQSGPDVYAEQCQRLILRNHLLKRSLTVSRHRLCEECSGNKGGGELHIGRVAWISGQY